MSANVLIPASSGSLFVQSYSDYADGLLVKVEVKTNGNFLLFFDTCELPVLMPASYATNRLKFDIVENEHYVAGWEDILVSRNDGRRTPQRQFYIAKA